MKRRLSIVLIIVMIVQGLGMIAFAEGDEETKLQTEAKELHALGLLSGTGDGFALDQPLTRAQAITFIIKLQGVQEVALQAEEDIEQTVFSDIEEGAWYAPYVKYCADKGIVAGYPDGTFKPSALIDEQAFLTLMLKTLGYEEDDFSWETVYEKADEIGLHNKENIQENTNTYKRQQVVHTIKKGLALEVKGKDHSLIQELVFKKQVPSTVAREIFKDTGAVTPPEENVVEPVESEDSLKTDIKKAKVLARHEIEVVFNEEIESLSSDQVQLLDETGRKHSIYISTELTRYVKLKTDRDLSKSDHELVIRNVVDKKGHVVSKLEVPLDAYDTALEKQVPVYIPPSNSGGGSDDDDAEAKPPVDKTLLRITSATPLSRRYVKLQMNDMVSTATEPTAAHFATNTDYVKVEKSYCDPSDRSIIWVETNASSGEYKLTVTGLKDDAGNELDPDTNTVTIPAVYNDSVNLALSDAYAMTKTEMWLIFDKAFDETTAFDTEHYTVTDEDGNQLAVTSASRGEWTAHSVKLETEVQEAGMTYTIQLRGVKNSEGALIDPPADSYTVTGSAQTGYGPQVESVEMLTAYAVQIEFDLAVDMDKALETKRYVIETEDEKPLSPYTVFEGEKNTQVIAVFDEAFAASTPLEVCADGIYDLNGNMFPIYKVDAVEHNFTEPQTLLIENVETLNAYQVKVTFDCDIDTDSNETVEQHMFQEVGSEITIEISEVIKDTSNSSIITLKTPMDAGKQYELQLGELRGAYGERLSEGSLSVTAEGSSIRPTFVELTSVELIDESTLEVQFNEEVYGTISKAAFAIYSNDDDLPTGANFEMGNLVEEVNFSEKRIHIDTTEPIQEGQAYFLRIYGEHGVIDSTGLPVLGEVEPTFAFNYGFAYPIDGYQDEVELIGSLSLNRRQIKLIFNQRIQMPQLSCITIVGEYDDHALHYGAANNLYMTDDAKAVVITFEDSMKFGEVYTVYVKDIFGEHGTSLAEESSSAMFAGNAGEMPSISARQVRVVDYETIEILFTGELSGTANPSAFALFTSNNTIQAETNYGADITVNEATVNDTKVTLTLSSAMREDTIYLLNIRSNHGLTNRGGVDVIEIDTGSGAPEHMFVTDINPFDPLTIDSVRMFDQNTITIYFTENITVTNDFELTTDIVLQNEDGETVVEGNEFKYYMIDDNGLIVCFKNEDKVEGTPDYEVSEILTAVVEPGKVVSQKDDRVVLTTENEANEDIFAVTDGVKENPRLMDAHPFAYNKIRVTLTEGLNAVPSLAENGDLIIYNASDDERLTPAALDVNGYDVGDHTKRSDKTFVIELQDGYMFKAGKTYELFFSATSALTDQFGICPVLKDDDDDGDDEEYIVDGQDHENDVRFSGIAD